MLVMKVVVAMMVTITMTASIALLSSSSPLASVETLSASSAKSSQLALEKMSEYDGAALFKGVPILDLSGGLDRNIQAKSNQEETGAIAGTGCLMGVYCPPAGWASTWQTIVSKMQKEMSTDTMEIANLKNQVSIDRANEKYLLRRYQGILTLKAAQVCTHI